MIQSVTDSFDHHVDARHFGFQWTEAMYIFVQYSAIKEGNKIVSSIDSITAEPWLIGSIVAHCNWEIVNKEIIEAGQDAARKEFARNGQVNQTLQALTPFI
jgi:hypothetical protein